MPDHIVDQWVKALDPAASQQVPLPPNIKGFYGGSLRASMPIEVARGSYKYIAHEAQDKVKIDKYATRMLLVLSLLDVDELEPTMACLALWHRALAQVRLLPGEPEVVALKGTLAQYAGMRSRSSLPESKLPGPARLAESLTRVAKEMGNEQALPSVDVLRDSEEA